MFFFFFWEVVVIVVDIGFVYGQGVGCLIIVVLLRHFCHPDMEQWQLTPYENSIKMCNVP